MSNVCDFGYEKNSLVRVYIQYICFFKSSSLFIENLRDIENCQLITFSLPKLIWHLDPLLDLRLVQWNQIQIHSSKYGKVSALVAVILVVYRRHCAELVVAGTSVDIVVVLFVHCTLSTILCFWRIFASDKSASGKLASDDVIFRSSFFRRTLHLTFQERFYSDALQASVLISFALKFIQSEPLVNKSLLMVLYTWINF